MHEKSHEDGLSSQASCTFFAAVSWWKDHTMSDQKADIRGRYVKADIDRLNKVVVKIVRQEEAECRSKTEHLRALRMARMSASSDE